MDCSPSGSLWRENNIIRNELNRYLLEIDEYYKENRESILKHQIEELKGIIVNRITGYKGIDEELVRRIANVSDTLVPPSTLKALKMDEYINKQKAIFIFSTNDKKSYKNDVESMFTSTTQMQYDSYIAEIMDVARAKQQNSFRNSNPTLIWFPATWNSSSTTKRKRFPCSPRQRPFWN